MKRTIEINEGIIMGYDVDNIIDLIPQLKDSFRQRQKFNEYYFDEIEIDITMDQLDELSKEYDLELGTTCLRILI